MLRFDSRYRTDGEYMRYSLLVAPLWLLLIVPVDLAAQEYLGFQRLPMPEAAVAPRVAPAAFTADPAARGVWDVPIATTPTAYDAGPLDMEPMQAPPEMVDYGTGGAHVYVQADALFWHRVGTGCDDVLATNVTTGDSLLSTGDLNFNGTGGFRTLVGWRPQSCCAHCSAWELSYFGIFGWDANQQVRGANDLAIPGDLGLASNNFFLTDILDISYRSQFNNIELNCIKSCCLGCGTTIDFLCGFRYINLNEELSITGTDFQEGTSSYNVQADNNLLGLQLGGRYTSQFTSCWSYQLTGKAGLFYNAVHQSQQATDFPNVGGAFSLRDPIGNDGSAVAALGELDFVLIRRLNDMWSLRLGYSVLGIGGLALAPDQLDFTDTTTSGSDLNTNGWMFLHGGLAGLEARW